MKSKRLALYTFGVFRAPANDAVNQGFHDRNDRNFLVAELSEGFIARSGYDDEPGPESWGEQVFPRFYVERGDGWSPSTLSLWKDLASPMAFSYAGVHAEALRHGREWFLKPAWPPYALWWVEWDHTPTWAEAVTRHEFLHDHNASPFAFDFKSAFDEDGRPTTIDRDAVKRNISLNQERQQHAMPANPKRLLIMGNGGCGKTWLARELGETLGIPVIHLDDMHWEPGHYGIARDRALRDADVQATAQADAWIMEGVYGQLVSMVLTRVTTLIWIDLPEEECMANIRQRGIQGGENQEQFEGLLKWVSEYRTRTKNWNSFEAHSRMFASHSGPKWLLTSRDEIAAFLALSASGKSVNSR